MIVRKKAEERRSAKGYKEQGKIKFDMNLGFVQPDQKKISSYQFDNQNTFTFYTINLHIHT